jgi:hypothetical protein
MEKNNYENENDETNWNASDAWSGISSWLRTEHDGE